METKKEIIQSSAVRFSVVQDDREVGRAFLFLIKNDLHDNPYGLLEDVEVDENFRGKGIGTHLVQHVIEEAKKFGCYKILATSRHVRPKVHVMYERLGFRNHGLEFRMDL